MGLYYLFIFGSDKAQIPVQYIHWGRDINLRFNVFIVIGLYYGIVEMILKF